MSAADADDGPLTLVVGDRAYSSWSLRGWLALRKAGVAFEERLVRLDTATMAAELAALSPARTVPVLQAGALVVWDSLAIGEWAGERAPSLWPADPARRAEARAATATMHAGFPAIRRDYPMNLHRVETPRRTAAGADAQAQLAHLDAFLSGLLARAEGGGLFGAWSLADAAYTPMISRLRSYGLWDRVSEPVRAYGARLLEDPDVKAWEEAARADPVRLAHVDAL